MKIEDFINLTDEERYKFIDSLPEKISVIDWCKNLEWELDDGDYECIARYILSISSTLKNKPEAYTTKQLVTAGKAVAKQLMSLHDCFILIWNFWRYRKVLWSN